MRHNGHPGHSGMYHGVNPYILLVNPQEPHNPDCTHRAGPKPIVESVKFHSGRGLTMSKRFCTKSKGNRAVFHLVVLLVLATSLLSIESAVGEEASVSVSLRIAPAIRASSDSTASSNISFVRICSYGFITFIPL